MAQWSHASADSVRARLVLKRRGSLVRRESSDRNNGRYRTTGRLVLDKVRGVTLVGGTRTLTSGVPSVWWAIWWQQRQAGPRQVIPVSDRRRTSARPLGLVAGFRATFFDFDGVLINSEPTWWLVIEEVLGNRDLIPAGGIERVDGLRLDQVIGRLVPGDQALARSIEDEVRRLATPRIAQLPLTDGAVEAVHELAAAGVVLGVVSSSAAALLDAVLQAHEVRQFLCVVIGGNEVKEGKPDPDGYRRAARQAMVPARQCCAVEDSSTGIEAAAAAGMQVIQFAPAEIAGKGRHFRARACVAAFPSVIDIALGRS